MPIIANAKKALRQAKARTTRNRVVRAEVRNVVKKSAKKPDADAIAVLYSTLDKAVKRHIIHKNKAARLKSQAAKRVANLGTETAKPAVKPTVKKPAKSASRRTVKKIQPQAKSRRGGTSKK